MAPGLSEFTFDKLAGVKADPKDAKARLEFYQFYFLDVVPSGVVVEHITITPPSDIRAQHPDSKTREELRLLTPSKKIFMSGLVSVEMSSDGIKSVAGVEARTQWRHGDFAPDGQDWRFFAAQEKLRLFTSRSMGEYNLKGEYDPIFAAGAVAEVLLQESWKLESR